MSPLVPATPRRSAGSRPLHRRRRGPDPRRRYRGAVRAAVARYAAALTNAAACRSRPLPPPISPASSRAPSPSSATASTGGRVSPTCPSPMTRRCAGRAPSTSRPATPSIVPASLVWHPFLHLRSAGDLPVVPPARRSRLRRRRRRGVARRPLRGGGARCRGVVLARDDAAAQLRLDTLPPPLRALVRRFEATGDRVALLEVDHQQPHPERLRGACLRPARGARLRLRQAANLDAADAVTDALASLAEARRLAKEAQRTRSPPSPVERLGGRDRRCRSPRLRRARENAERIAFILTSEDRRHLAERESATTGSVAGDLDAASAASS